MQYLFPDVQWVVRTAQPQLIVLYYASIQCQGTLQNQPFPFVRVKASHDGVVPLNSVTANWPQTFEVGVLKNDGYHRWLL